MKINWNKPIIVWVGALICCALWGSAFPCIKLGYLWMNIDSADTASQILYAGFRFIIAGFLAVLIASFTGKTLIIPEKKALGKICKLSLFQTIIQYLFFYVGLAHCSGVKASIVEGMNVFVVVIFSCLVFKMEKITSKKAVGCIVGFLGVILVNLNGSGLEGGFSLLGEGFIFLSTISYGVSSVLLKRYSKSENPIMLSGYQFIVGGLVMAIVGKAFGGNINCASFQAAMMLIYLAMVSAMAYSLWGVLLKHNPASMVAVFGFMNPVFGVILSAVLLSEYGMLRANCLVALVLVCVGIYIVNKE